MERRIVNIDNILKQNYKEVLDKGLNKSDRPYYVSFKRNNYNILIPIRSNIPNSPYSLPLENRIRGNRHGMDFCKMLILTDIEMNIHTTNGFVRSETMQDISSKRALIISKINKTISDYKIMLSKKMRGEDLSSDEYFLKKRSTLINFIDRI